MREKILKPLNSIEKLQGKKDDLMTVSNLISTMDFLMYSPLLHCKQSKKSYMQLGKII